MWIVRLMMLSVIVIAASTEAATVVPIGEFRSIELNHGGRVIVRHGAVQRVFIVKGDLQSTRVRLGDGQRLIIGSSGEDCPRGYQLEIEVVTPHFSRVSVSNGGTVQALGPFPAQASIEAAVEQGGTIDIRSIAAESVDASVDSGGRILTTSRKTLAATVESGGVITYWGGPQDVRKSVRDGGAVTKGAAREADKPLADVSPARLPALPTLPPLSKSNP